MIATQLGEGWVSGDPVAPFLRKKLPLIEAMIHENQISLRDIARALVDVGITYRTGNPWTEDNLQKELTRARSVLRQSGRREDSKTRRRSVQRIKKNRSPVGQSAQPTQAVNSRSTSQKSASSPDLGLDATKSDADGAVSHRIAPLPNHDLAEATRPKPSTPTSKLSEEIPPSPRPAEPEGKTAQAASGQKDDTGFSMAMGKPLYEFKRSRRLLPTDPRPPRPDLSFD